MPNFDVAIVGGGPAGLSAALTLGRPCRSVIVFDHGKYRNSAATAVHCYLGNEGISPAELRGKGRKEARRYDVNFCDREVTNAVQLSKQSGLTAFQITAEEKQFDVRMVLLASGMMDELPAIEGLRDRYGSSVHHCPYCDGWECRTQHLVALAKTSKNATKLALTLRGWSRQVTACTNGIDFSPRDRERLDQLQIPYNSQNIKELAGAPGGCQRVVFEDDSSIPFDGLFFSSDQGQRSPLPKMLGCYCDSEDCVKTADKQCTNVSGVYLAGDADGDVQFSIVAAAEGAIAATAIHQALLDQDFRSDDSSS